MGEAENSSAAASKANNLQVHRNNEAQPEMADFLKRLHGMIAGDSRNFDSWIALIEEVEGMYLDNLDVISLAYESFLSRFPLCHWYWTQYTDHILRLSDAHKAIKVYECAVDTITFSLGLWIDYCCFGMSFYEDPCDVRRLFKRAFMFVQRDYFCCALWDQYIKFEFTQQHWGSLANMYLQVLRFPTEFLHKYYENFKRFVAGMEEEVRKCTNSRIEVEGGVLPNIAANQSEDDITNVIEALQNCSNEALIPKAVRKYEFIGEKFYQKAKELDVKIKTFETNILRRYFDPAPLDDEQLETWHNYLDFIEKQEDFEWALQLYERCLISCANYPEFWMRYVEFMESKGGRELADSALKRATQVFLKDVPEIHLFSARFKERIGDANAACDMGSDSYLSKHIVELANMQRRLGNLEAASDTLHKAINMAEKKQKLHQFSSLFIHSSRLKYMITGSNEAARDVLIDGIRRIPHCSELLKELIRFAMTHEGAKQVTLVDSIVAHAISPSFNGSQGLALKDRECVSSLFLEFVDLCGTVEDVRKAWNRHVKLFPQLVRNNVVDKQLGLENCLSNEFLEQRESSPCAHHNLQAESQKSNWPIEKQVSIRPTDQASKGKLVSADLTPQRCNDNVEGENRQQISTDSKLAASEVNEVADDLVPIDDTPGVVESTENLEQQPTNNVSGLVQINPTLVHSSSDMSGANDLTCNFSDQPRGIANLEPSQDHSCSINMQDQELEHHQNPVSFDNLSLNSKEKASKDLIASISDEHEAILDNPKSNVSMARGCLNAKTNPPKTCPKSIPAEPVRECSSHGNKSADSPTNHEKSMTTEMHLYSLVAPSASGEYDQLQRATVSEHETSGVHLHSQDAQHQHQQPSTLLHIATVLPGSQMPTSLAYPHHPLAWKQGDPSQVHHKEGVVQENIATDHVWPVNNVSVMSSSSTNGSCVSSPHGSISQPTTHGSQSELRPVITHHGQTLTQTWQYQQHLLQQQYQQQLAQLLSQQQHQHYQHSYHHEQQSSWQQKQYLLQQQQLQSIPYQVQQQLPYLQLGQPQLQQHYLQSTEHVHLQQGQQQQQQFQQVNEQQIQLYPQSEKLAYEMHQQGYQQHAAQTYQALLQQYQLHQQGYGQMLQQHQQHQNQYNQMVQQQLLHQLPQQQQQDDEQEENHQQKASNRDLPEGISEHLQVQQNARNGDSAQTQYLSPQSTAQPNIKSQSG